MIETGKIEVRESNMDRALRWLSRKRSGLKEFWRLYRKNRLAVIGGIILLLFIVLAIGAPWITSHDPERPNFAAIRRPPAWMEGGNWTYPLGTDHLGRDLLTRIIYGARISLLVGFIVVFFATSLGVALGLISGYYGGKVDAFIQRVIDTLLAFPYLILALALVAVMGPGLKNMLLALVYKEWIYPCRVVRGEVLVAKEQEYVEAAKAVGASNFHIMVKEILPNVLGSVIVVSTLRVAWVILMEASLSFLGLGVEPPTPAWGTIINEGRRFMNTEWWISTFPGLAILLTVLGINLMGEGLRDALDPRLRE
ncbi:MAG: ABC transporter permease [Limnochordia bacterium]|jgi:peptide/nickel transport system permease protein